MIYPTKKEHKPQLTAQNKRVFPYPFPLINCRAIASVNGHTAFKPDLRNLIKSKSPKVFNTYGKRKKSSETPHKNMLQINVYLTFLV